LGLPVAIKNWIFSELDKQARVMQRHTNYKYTFVPGVLAIFHHFALWIGIGTSHRRMKNPVEDKYFGQHKKKKYNKLKLLSKQHCTVFIKIMHDPPF
jgi:hypothetical protein